MKITKAKLKQIIKEELEEAHGDRHGTHRVSNAALYDYLDARLGQQLAILLTDAVSDLDMGTQLQIKKLVDDMIIRETEKEPSEDDPNKVIARHPDPEGKNPDQVIYKWQQDEFDQHQAAWKAFNKRNKK